MDTVVLEGVLVLDRFALDTETGSTGLYDYGIYDLDDWSWGDGLRKSRLDKNPGYQDHQY